MDTIKVDAKILNKLKHDIERAERMPLPKHVTRIFKYFKEKLLEAVDKGDEDEQTSVG